jgi:hypothetical protein
MLQVADASDPLGIAIACVLDGAGAVDWVERTFLKLVLRIHKLLLFFFFLLLLLFLFLSSLSLLLGGLVLALVLVLGLLLVASN